jgi:hypothetical protein
LPVEMRGSGRCRRSVDVDGNRRRLKAHRTWHLGKRQKRDADLFIRDLPSPVDSGVQITTDRFGNYAVILAALITVQKQKITACSMTERRNVDTARWS